MTNHGFGVITLKSGKSSMGTNHRIARCISRVPGIAYAHAIHKGFAYDSRIDEKGKNIYDKEVESQWDIIFEIERRLDKAQIEDITKCARDHGHEIDLKLFTVQHPNWRHGNEIKHP